MPGIPLATEQPIPQVPQGGDLLVIGTGAEAFTVVSPKMVPNNAAYAVFLRFDRSSVDRGYLSRKKDRTVKIGVRMTGDGQLLLSKLLVDLPIGLLDPKDPGTRYATIRVVGTPLTSRSNRLSIRLAR